MFRTTKRKALATLASIALLAGAGSAAAADLTIGRSSEQQSIDPQFSRTGPNQATAAHIFDGLMDRDAKGAFVPSLAESFKNVDAKTWEAKLRPGVTFSDGSPLTAEDVVYSLERAPNVPNSPASFAGYVANIASMTIVDPMTIRFATKSPDPNFSFDVGGVFIVSKKATEGASNADFNSGKAAIGTGPYKFVSWTPGDELKLTRNDAYWGGKPEFDNVTVRFITNDAARVAALLSGSVDLIDLVPPADQPRLRGDSKISVYSTASSRLIYMALNQRADNEAPGVTDLDGKPLGKNPFKDARVRQAISMMIDRKGIVDRILFGEGEPTMNQVPVGMFGSNPDLKPVYDPVAAKKLLADAGYPNGFGMVLSGSNDRFLSDGDVTQAIGQFLARGGIKINKVETFPYSVYAKGATAGDYGAFIFSNGNSSGEAGNGLEATMRTYNKEEKTGSLNRHRYSNPEFDKAIAAANAEFDAEKRWKMLAEAAALVMKDGGVIPLYHQSVTWAARKGVTYTPRSDERTLAMGASVTK